MPPKKTTTGEGWHRMYVRPTIAQRIRVIAKRTEQPMAKELERMVKLYELFLDGKVFVKA
jgi:hypothetical protein